jgi:hypothetical protein
MARSKQAAHGRSLRFTRPSRERRPTSQRPARRSLCTPAAVDALVLRLISRQCHEQLSNAMRGCARSLQIPSGELQIESLNRVHESIARAIAAQPEVMAVLGEAHAAAREAGCPRWDGHPSAPLNEVIAAVREAARSLLPVH